MAVVNKPKSEINPRLLVRPQKSQVSVLRPSALVHTTELGLKCEECKQYLENLTGKPTC